MNNLTDLTVNRHFAALTGYTQAELENSFAPYMSETEALLELTHEELLAQLSHWYNGYSWDGRTYVYNPFSILNFFLHEDFRDFWFETGFVRRFFDNWFVIVFVKKEAVLLHFMRSM